MAKRCIGVSKTRPNSTKATGAAATPRHCSPRSSGCNDELLRTEWQIAELEARADVDPLTDILNRRGFDRELKRSLAYISRYGTDAALVFLDLDGFKGVNDRHGHAAGDALLKAVARELTGRVRASDVVARLGGDEFVVLLWNVNATQALAKARDLETVIASGVGTGRRGFGRRQRRRCAARGGYVAVAGDGRRGRGHVCAQERAARLGQPRPH